MNNDTIDKTLDKTLVYNKLKYLTSSVSKMTQNEKIYYVKFFDSWLIKLKKNKHKYDKFYNALENWIKALYLFMSKSDTLLFPFTENVIEYLDIENEGLKLFCLDLLK